MGKSAKKKKVPIKRELFDTGKLAKNLFSVLADDFRREGFTISPRPLTYLRANDLQAFRQWEFIEGMNLPPMYLKMARQMNNLLAKYTFQNDAVSPELRHIATVTGWMDDAVRIGQHAELDYPTQIIVHEARKIVKGILGPLPSFDEVASFGRIGTRATRMCSKDHAGLDVYLSDPAAFSSSSQCLTWVKEVLLPGDSILSDLLGGIVATANEGIESIVLTLVPKKWNKDRPITPLQLTDLLYSYAYGKFVEVRLAAAGLDIQKLQALHRKLVRRQSVQKTYATVDLSGGSNNITKQHMLLLTPRPWYRTFTRCLTHSLAYSPVMGGDACNSVWTSSVLPMGNALTFPLETLYFYSIAEATRRLVGCRGFVSCYGDDLIYPSRIHGYVVHAFKKLNWAMNLDKTFVSFDFRESCGEDYYRGVAVRPFFFPDVQPKVGRMTYRRLLYQIYNGLLERWDKQYLTKTLRLLLVEISMLGEVYRVPPDYPEYAGIRTQRPFEKVDPMVPYAKILCEWCPDIQNFRWTFSCLSEVARLRRATSAIPIYWDQLRQRESLQACRILEGLPAFDPLSYLSNNEVSNLVWRGFKRRVVKHGKTVRKYIAWKLYVPTSKTKMTDELTQTFYWSEVSRWLGTAGYTAAQPPLN